MFVAIEQTGRQTRSPLRKEAAAEVATSRKSGEPAHKASCRAFSFKPIPKPKAKMVRRPPCAGTSHRPLNWHTSIEERSETPRRMA
jgi:hypothetical protein